MSRSSRFVDFQGIALEAGESLHGQTYEQLRRLIASGQISEGTRLPSTRELAAQLTLSRNTVQLAYNKLRDEGYTETRVGSGTRVRRRLPPATSRAQVELPRAARSVAAFKLATPALDEFPHALWLRAQAESGRRWSRRLLAIEAGPSFEPLRREVATYLGVSRGVECDPSQLMIVPGSQAAIDLVCRVLVKKGDSVWVEDPCYPGAVGAMRLAGATVVPVPVDGEGLAVDEGLRRASDARVAYVTPSQQFPLGTPMSAARREALLAWARDQDGWIVEDDFGWEFQYDGRPAPALHGQDPDGRVLYMGTFSNVTFPALRLGYIVVPTALRDKFEDVRRVTDVMVPTVNQATLAEFMAEGHLARHVRRMRSLYQRRRDALLSALRASAQGWLTPHRWDAGMHVVCWLPGELDGAWVAASAADQGVEARSLSSFYLEPPRGSALVLGYTAISDSDIAAGVSRLADVVRYAAGHRARGLVAAPVDGPPRASGLG